MQFDTELQYYIKLVLASYKDYTGDVLAKDIEALYNANFVSASHYFYQDGIRFIFANRKALELWEMTWSEFTSIESHYSASEDKRAERSQLLETVKKNGIIRNYTGIRVSKTGKQFLIKDAIVWNVNDNESRILGQAVKFDNYSYCKG